MKVAFDQHFLSDEGIAKKIADAAGIRPDDAVLEIGPGKGALTMLLSARAKTVSAVEIDSGLIPILQRRMKGQKNVIISEENGLSAVFAAPFDVLVSNTPYGILEALLRRMAKAGFRKAVLVMPIGFFKRISARPGEEGYSALSLFSSLFFDVKELFGIPASAWDPPPDTESIAAEIVPRRPSSAAEDIMREVLLQHDKKAINALCEAITRKKGLSKKEAGKMVNGMGLSDALLEKKIQSLPARELLLIFRAVGKMSA